MDWVKRFDSYRIFSLAQKDGSGGFCLSAKELPEVDQPGVAHIFCG
jgi:hypothetical protein